MEEGNPYPAWRGRSGYERRETLASKVTLPTTVTVLYCILRFALRAR